MASDKRDELRRLTQRNHAKRCARPCGETKQQEEEDAKNAGEDNEEKRPYPSPLTYVVHDIEGVETTYNVLVPREEKDADAPVAGVLQYVPFSFVYISLSTFSSQIKITSTFLS